LRLFSFGGYGLALAALALVVFGAYDSYPGKVSIAVKTFGVCDFSRLAVTDWRLWFLALTTATPQNFWVLSSILI